MKTFRAIKSIAHRFIQWPSRDEYAELSDGHRLVDTIGIKIYVFGVCLLDI